MLYVSTRGGCDAVSSSTAITCGIASDGGLFVPDEFPQIKKDDLIRFKKHKYQQVAKFILSLFLEDFSEEEINEAVDNVYNDNFDDKDIVPVIKLTDKLFVSELWHGPTLAFKDIALQLLPQLMEKSISKNNIDEKMLILVATSGDTGKAALDGFCDVKKTNIVVYYPDKGVSDIQYLQMATQEGENTAVIAVEGNFDDTQNGVKKIFGDISLYNSLLKKGYKLSSANSINWGRLLPQIVYYFTSYVKISTDEEIKNLVPVDFIVPTGNFGNILAGFYAKKMGLPIGKLICASNSNKILFDFLNTGNYNTQRKFTKTISPSMDIIISSNFERLLYTVANGDSDFVKKLQLSLKNDKKYSVTDIFLNSINESFTGGWADDIKTKDYIKKIWNKYHYLLDPHTAVGFAVLDDIKTSGNKQIVMSTANPYKFTSAVLDALTGKNSGDGFEDMKQLHKITGITPPIRLSDLKTKKIMHNSKCSKFDMSDALNKVLS